MKPKSSKFIVIKLISVIFIFIFIGLFIYIKNPRIDNLKINEVYYGNDLGYDWVEIYNPTLQTKSLKGLFLTDDKLDLEKFEIDKDILIEPNSFLVLYGENYENENESENILKLNFNIKNGETIYLIEKKSLAIIDSLTVLNKEDTSSENKISIGRFPDGSENTFVFTKTSPGEKNKKDHITGIKPKKNE